MSVERPEAIACLECGAVWYSPPAADVAARAAGCLMCGGALAPVEGERLEVEGRGGSEDPPTGPDEQP
jgi:hypothetical protein